MRGLYSMAAVDYTGKNQSASLDQVADRAIVLSPAVPVSTIRNTSVMNERI